MRPQVIRPWLGLAATLCCACTPAPRPAPHVITAPSVLQPVPAPSSPELTAVPDPAGLVAVARLRNPQATFSAATKLAQMPELSLTALLSLLGASDRAGLFRLDASVDLAMLIDPDTPKDDPKFLAAVSVPLRDLEESRATLASTFQPIAPGVFRGTLEPQLKEGGRPSACDLAASVGDAPARLVCADSERELDSLRPWLTRTLPRSQPAPTDLRLELRARPFQQAYETEIAAGIDEASHSASGFLQRELKVQEPELLEAPGIVLRETASFFNDLDTLRLDASLDPTGETVSMRGTLAFRSTEGWYTRLLTHRNDRSGPPPAVFWRLPRDSETALHARGVDASYYEGIYRVLRLAANRLLAPSGASERSRAAVDEFFGAMPGPDVVSASATGTLPAGPTAEVRTAADSVKAFKSLADSLLGWSVTGIEAPSGQYVAWLRKGGTAIDLLLQDLRKQLPAPDRVYVPSAKLHASPAGLPKGSIALDLTWSFDSRTSWRVMAESGMDHPAGAPARGQLTFRMIVVPDGPNRTWFGFSCDPATLQKRVASVLANAPESGTIASRNDLEPLRREPASYSGFVSYGSAMGRGFGTSKKWGSEHIQWLHSAIESAPHKLQTPVLLMGTGTTGPAPASSLEIRLQRGSLEDLSAVVRYLLKHPPPPTSLPYP